MMKSFHPRVTGKCGNSESCEPDGGAGSDDNGFTWNKNRIVMGVITAANGSTELAAG